ncbi:MAG: SWIM zinc finger family protein [Bacteroidales bacterium]|nr:SWIM zinc finger family protein [Bacteroidales bacterium]
MGKFFGKTWWGERWLNALSGIDLSNRIPRGSSYAKNGMVKSLKFSGNKVSAVVQGTWNYFVDIEIPEFDGARFENFIGRLREKPAVISKLLNRELDPEILDIAQKSGLKVFPGRWSDIRMHCDCPDSAVPCKHLAAVIYTISREIDNNPFVVFKLHGVDLIEELKKRGLELDAENLIEVPDLESLFEKDKKPSPSGEFFRVDFSVINDNIQAIGNILPKETPFYPTAGFYKKYNSEILYIAKTAKLILEKKSDFFERLCENSKTNFDGKITNDTEFQIFADSDFNFFVAEKDTEKTWPIEEVLSQVFKIPRDYITDFSPSVIALNQIIACALYLLTSGNFAPAVFKTSVKNYF